MTTYTVRKGNPTTTRTDAVVIGVRRGAGGAIIPCPGAEPVADAFGRRFAPMLGALGFKGKPGEVVRLPSGGTIRAAGLVVVGVADDAAPLTLRRAAGTAARTLGNAASVALALPAGDATQVRAVTEGFLAGGYGYPGLRSGRESDDRLAEVVVLSAAARRQDVVAAFETAQLVEELTRQVRDWVNTPPNELTPERFAAAVAALRGHRDRRRGDGVRVEVLGPDRLEELGCGGILGVGGGSANGPRLVRLRWRPKEPVAKVALVGKGITYDSGGLTIKPGSSMPTMKCDMAGAAAVVAAVHAVARLDLPVEVVALAPMAENMPSGTAMRPGDVLRIRNGRTVEVTNTDAEGRLVLADALSLAVEERPDRILEISTLTGPCVTALGDRIAGLFGDDDVVADVRTAAETVGELVWHLPIPAHIAANVREDSRVADVLQHNWVRWGSASFAAAFLTQFTDEVPFAHLDVAGPAWNNGGPWGDVPAGATGFGVRTLVEAVRALADGRA